MIHSLKQKEQKRGQVANIANKYSNRFREINEKRWQDLGAAMR